MSGPGGIASLPGFDASLRLLIERERYSLSDIGMMFGVSRERIRQIAERAGVAHPDSGTVGLFCVRVWDDRAHCFRPVSRGVIAREAHQAEVVTRRAARTAKRAERRAAMVAAIAPLRARLHRDPTHREMWLAVGGDPARTRNFASMLAGLWGRRNNTSEAGSEALAELHAATGTRVRGRGTRGHTGRRALRSHCARGHAWTEVNTYHWNGVRQCRACKDRHRKASRNASRSAHPSEQSEAGQ